MQIGKLFPSGKIVEIMRVSARVMFSDDLGWILIDPDLGKPDPYGGKRPNIRWIPISTRFEWVRDFTSLPLTDDS